jgi:hypothetical protein
LKLGKIADSGSGQFSAQADDKNGALQQSIRKFRRF